MLTSLPIRFGFMILLMLGGVGFAQSIDSVTPRRYINLPDLSEEGAYSINPLQENKIRYELIRSFETTKSLHYSESATAYTQRLTDTLLPENRFVHYLLASHSFGASAYLGGLMVTQLGLWDRCSTVDCFAAVISHEIIHQKNRHLQRMLADSSPNQWWGLLSMMAGMVAIANNQGQAGQALLYTGSALPARQWLSFSRSMETEADREGIALLAEAGFAPSGMVSAMEILDRYHSISEGGDSAEATSFFRTHPLSAERVTLAKNRADTVQQKVLSEEESMKRNALSFEYQWIRATVADSAIRPQAISVLRAQSPHHTWLTYALPLLEGADINHQALKQLLDNLPQDTRAGPIVWASIAELLNHTANIQPQMANGDKKQQELLIRKARMLYPHDGLLALLDYRLTLHSSPASALQIVRDFEKNVLPYTTRSNNANTLLLMDNAPRGLSAELAQAYRIVGHPMMEKVWIIQSQVARGQLSNALQSVQAWLLDAKKNPTNMNRVRLLFPTIEIKMKSWERTLSEILSAKME